MIIVWRGLGILVLLIFGGALAATEASINSITGTPAVTHEYTTPRTGFSVSYCNHSVAARLGIIWDLLNDSDRVWCKKASTYAQAKNDRIALIDRIAYLGEGFVRPFNRAAVHLATARRSPT